MQDNMNNIDIFDHKYKFYEDKDYDMLDFVFQAFSNSEDEAGFKSQYPVNGGKCDEQLGKLYNVLKYFAEKDGGEISEETKDMLRNNNAFVNFVGSILSYLLFYVKEEFQPEFAKSLVKRYELSELAKETGLSF
jgi:hypothetical protein